MQLLPAAAALAAVRSAAAADPFAPRTSPRRDRRAAYAGSLLSRARPTANSQLGRRLDEDGALDLTGYAVRFEKCQYVRQYAEERDEDRDDVLETQRFVVFRLCPDEDCGAASADGSGGCSAGYGEYLVDMATYLEATLEHKQDAQERYCQACAECADDDGAADNGGDDDGGRRRRRLGYDAVNCGTCYQQCQNIENMEDNGYADAAEYVNCEKVYENDNTGVAYYAGAICDHYGSRIKVGLFTDEDCTLHDDSVSVDQYLKNEDGYNVKLSYHLLKQTFASDECVASCTRYDEDANDADDDGQQNAETAEVCEELYEAAGKCEAPHGFAAGLGDTDDDLYYVQRANEEAVCDFLADIRDDRYDATGEIVVTGGRQTQSAVQTTGGQKFALTFFAIGCFGLAAYAVLLHHKISRGEQPGLSPQDGALA